MKTTSLSLLVRLRRHDAQEAWARFAQLYTPLLFYWAKRIGLSSSDADDFVQDVLLLLLGKIGQFEPRGPGSFRAWLRTVAVNKCRRRRHGGCRAVSSPSRCKMCRPHDHWSSTS